MFRSGWELGELKKIACSAAVLAVAAGAGAATLYSTGFEPSQGCALGAGLAGNPAWQEQLGAGDPDFTYNSSRYHTGSQSLFYDTAAASGNEQEFAWVPLSYNPATSDKIIEGEVALNFTDYHDGSGELANSWFGLYAFHSPQPNPFCDIQVQSDHSLWVDAAGSSHQYGVLAADTWYTFRIRLDYTTNKMSAFLNDTQLLQTNFGGAVVTDFSIGAVPAGYNTAYFDDYAVRTTPTPEPTSWLGLGIGLAVLIRGRK